MREDFAVKARRLLAEGRVTIRRVGFASADYATVVASVRGDSAEIYAVTYAPKGGWSCTCPARSRCSHEQAVMLCTVPAAALGAYPGKQASAIGDYHGNQASPIRAADNHGYQTDADHPDVSRRRDTSSRVAS